MSVRIFWQKRAFGLRFGSRWKLGMWRHSSWQMAAAAAAVWEPQYDRRRIESVTWENPTLDWRQRRAGFRDRQPTHDWVTARSTLIHGEAVLRAGAIDGKWAIMHVMPKLGDVTTGGPKKKVIAELSMNTINSNKYIKTCRWWWWWWWWWW